MENKVYNQKGKEVGKVKLPKTVFDASWNADLVHQVAVSMQANTRSNIAHTKDRSEVRGGGKKPWKQKGTGRARHGSSRSPIWAGGGVTFGPRNTRVFSKKINKKMGVRALFAVLSKKLIDTEVLFVDALKFDTPKSSEAKAIILALAKIKGFEALATKKHNAALIVLADKDTNAQKSFSNFANIRIVEVRNLNTLDILKYKYVIIANPEEASKQLELRFK